MSDQNPVDAVITNQETTLEGLFPELAEYLKDPESAPPSKASEETVDHDAPPTEDIPPPYGVDDESLLKHAEDKFAPPQESETPPSDETEGEAQETAPSEPSPSVEGEVPQEPRPEPEPAPEAPTVEIGGQSYRQEDIAQLLAFRQELERNPQLQRAVVEGLTQPQAQPYAQPEQVPQTAQIPEDLDPDDPTFKALFPAIQALYNQNQQLNNVVQTHYNQWMNEQVAQRDAIISRAKQSFAQQHDLSESQVNELADIAGRYNVVGTYMSGTDPVTGQPVRPDPLMAVERALEAAYFSKPDYRDREFKAQVQRLKDDHKRKTKLAAVSGNSGSAPRTAPQPRNEAERRQQMIEFVAGHMLGGEAGA